MNDLGSASNHILRAGRSRPNALGMWTGLGVKAVALKLGFIRSFEEVAESIERGDQGSAFRRRTLLRLDHHYLLNREVRGVLRCLRANQRPVQEGVVRIASPGSFVMETGKRDAGPPSYRVSTMMQEFLRLGYVTNRFFERDAIATTLSTAL